MWHTIPGPQVDPPSVGFHFLGADLKAVDVEPAQDLQEGGEVGHVVFQERLHLPEEKMAAVWQKDNRRLYKTKIFLGEFGSDFLCTFCTNLEKFPSIFKPKK